MQEQERKTMTSDDENDIRQNRDVAAFSYLWIMSIVIFFARGKSPFVRFHARQGIVLFLLSIPSAMIPFLGKILLFFILAGMFLGFVHAARGERVELPVVGGLARGEFSAHDAVRSAIRAGRDFLNGVEEFLHRGGPGSPPSMDK